ncbi:flavodoxin family protein [Chloroflexota bacterium]
MKVLGIVCSPRKGGNTEILVEEALAGAREAGAQSEIVLVAGKNIAPCDGCLSCRKTSECKIKDDMQPIYQQLEMADAIIFGTPVYLCNVSAQAKIVMDRTFLFRGDRRLEGKVAAPIIATRRTGAGLTRAMLYHYIVTNKMIAAQGSIGYGSQKGDVRTGEGNNTGSSAMEDARNVGKDVVQMVQRISKPK